MQNFVDTFSLCIHFSRTKCTSLLFNTSYLSLCPPRQAPAAAPHSDSSLLPSSKMVQMTGSYTRVSEEGYEDVLKALNVGFMLRKAALASTPTMTITEAGGQWNMVTKTTMKSIDLKFR